jgi:hypothetical protein
LMMMMPPCRTLTRTAIQLLLGCGMQRAEHQVSSSDIGACKASEENS